MCVVVSDCIRAQISSFFRVQVSTLCSRTLKVAWKAGERWRIPDLGQLWTKPVWTFFSPKYTRTTICDMVFRDRSILWVLTGNQRSWVFFVSLLKECGMGPWLVLVSPCFRENVVATCKTVSFLCSLDKLLQKNVIVLFFGNQISKWRSFEKKGYFWPTFHIFSHQGKVTKIPSAHISLTYKHVFCSSYWLVLLYQFWKKKNEFIRYGFSLVWVLVLIRIRAILEQSINNKMVSKISVGMSTTDISLH